MRNSLLAGLLLLLSTSNAHAAINFDLDLFQGFRFAETNTRPVGYITSLQIGTTSFSSDFAVRDPSKGSQLSVVGVMEKFAWPGGGGDSKQLSFNVSLTNRNLIQNLMRDPGLAGKDVKISYVIFNYDTRRFLFFPTLKPKTFALSARFVISSGQILLNVSPNPDPVVPNPASFKALLGLQPGRAEQFVLYTPAYGSTPQSKAWVHSGPRFQ